MQTTQQSSHLIYDGGWKNITLKAQNPSNHPSSTRMPKMQGVDFCLFNDLPSPSGVRPDKNVLATTQLLGGTAPAHHHQVKPPSHYSQPPPPFTFSYRSEIMEIWQKHNWTKNWLDAKECEWWKIWSGAGGAGAPCGPACTDQATPSKSPKFSSQRKFYPIPLQNLPFLFVELSQLSYKVLLFLAIHRRLFVQYFRHFEALPLSHNVHSIFRRN